MPLPPPRPSLDELFNRRVSRRHFVTVLGLGAGALSTGVLPGCRIPPRAPTPTPPRLPGPPLAFKEVSPGIDDRLHLPPDHRGDVLLRWGDPVLPGAAPFDPHSQSPERQLTHFGTNADFIAFFPLPRGSQNSSHGLLCVNHEYPNGELMFPGFANRDEARERCSKDQAQVMMAAMGHSVIEVRRDHGEWKTLPGSYSRRVSPLHTAMPIEGPLRGHPRMRTTADPEGTTITGTLANCSGGVTPWGTVLLCEENIEHYFKGSQSDHPESDNHQRYGLFSSPRFPFYRFDRRFDLTLEPNEGNRFGWVVELDPYDPTRPPVKRTALGRIPRESATTVLNSDGRVVVYSGDDHAFEYLYRFVSRDAFTPDAPEKNRDLLNAGTLSVARFDADGSLSFGDLVFGEGPLTPANGFADQADVLLEARRAADLLGATPMDRPEDIDVCPKTGRVYIMLTGNPKRTPNQLNGPNPRAHNQWGHILELTPGPGADAPDHTAKGFTWDLLLLAGDPRSPEHQASGHPDTSQNGILASPDNCTVDRHGRLWVSTDGAEESLGTCDGLWACATTGAERALTKRFLRAPAGSEVCSPHFTPDHTTLFVAIQHPGAGKGSTFDQPKTRWPDFDPTLPPRASVVAIQRQDGEPVGEGPANPTPEAPR